MSVAATATARMQTASASRYLQQLCKHWSHNLAVEFTPDHGTVVFPRDARGNSWAGDAKVTFAASPAGLDCRIDASEPAQLEGLKGAVHRHLERFAFREAPIALIWHSAAD